MFTIRPQQLVHETIDGETIVIDMATGTYYSLLGLGSELWAMLADGADRDQLLSYSTARYDGDSVEITAAVEALLADLISASLVVEDSAERAPATATAFVASSRIAFVAFGLEKFTDMQQFMLVDPVHDVDSAVGWPHVPSP